VGSQPGEKLFEELLADVEVPEALEDDELLICPGEDVAAARASGVWRGRAVRPARAAYRSSDLPCMTRQEIEAMLARMERRRPAAGGPAR
jgi:hypothetical protein